MSEIFSPQWMLKYKQLWDANDKLISQLSDANFSANVAFGIIDEEKPRCVLVISHGQLAEIKAYAGEDLQWDLRASPDYWIEISKKAPSLMKLGLAYTTRKLKFNKGDYTTMIKDPLLSLAFINSIEMMEHIYHA